MKLPDIKYESKHNDELRSYAIGWNTIVENTEYLCKEFGYEYAKENLLKNKDFAYEHMMMPYYKGKYDCIIEIERLNEEEELIMTEKQFIEVLEKMQERCETTRCWECIFKSSSSGLCCQIRKITKALNTIPKDWNIEKIEELINE